MKKILFELMIGIFTGMIIGIIGLHINLVLPLSWNIGPIFLISSTVSWYFFSLIPTILLRIPNNENIIVLNKINKEVKKGNGIKIIKNTLINSFIIIFVCFILVSVYSYLIKNSKSLVKLVLILIVLSFIKSKRSFLLILFCAIFGYITFNLTEGNYLFEILSGFFAIPIYLFSEKFKIVDQIESDNLEIKKESIIIPWISIIFSCFPSISSSISAYFSSKLFKLNIIYGMIFSELTFLIISILYFESIRSGTAYYLSLFHTQNIVQTFLIILFSVSISSIIIFRIIKYYKIFLILYKPKLFILIILTICFFIHGVYGLFLLSISSLIGILCNIWKIDRSILLTTLMFPLIIT